MFRGRMFHGKQWPPQRPRPRNSSGPSSRSSQSSGLCPKTLLVSVERGGGAATRHLVTDHQKEERERQSNHCLRLRAFRPATPSQSGLYIRKESAEGSALREPVRPWALSLPSAGTRSQSAGGQTPVPARACNTRPDPTYERARSGLSLCRVGVRAWRNTLSPADSGG